MWDSVSWRVRERENGVHCGLNIRNNFNNKPKIEANYEEISNLKAMKERRNV